MIKSLDMVRRRACAVKGEEREREHQRSGRPRKLSMYVCSMFVWHFVSLPILPQQEEIVLVIGANEA